MEYRKSSKGLGAHFQHGLDAGNRHALHLITPLGSIWVPLWRARRDATETCETYGFSFQWSGEFRGWLFLDWGESAWCKHLPIFDRAAE